MHVGKNQPLEVHCVNVVEIILISQSGTARLKIHYVRGVLLGVMVFDDLCIHVDAGHF